jgi:hypothetical protein
MNILQRQISFHDTTMSSLELPSPPIVAWELNGLHLQIRHLKDLVLCRLNQSRAEGSSNFLYILIVLTSSWLLLDTVHVSSLLSVAISCLFSKHQTMRNKGSLGRHGFKSISPRLEDKANLLANGGREVIQDPETNPHHVDIRSPVCKYQHCMSSPVLGVV